MSHRLWGFLYGTSVSFHERGNLPASSYSMLQAVLNSSFCKIPEADSFSTPSFELYSSQPMLHPAWHVAAILLFPCCKNSLPCLLSDSLPLLWLLPSHSTMAQPAKDGVPRKGSTSASTAWLGQHKENRFNKIYFWRFYLSWSNIMKTTSEIIPKLVISSFSAWNHNTSCISALPDMDEKHTSLKENLMHFGITLILSLTC